MEQGRIASLLGALLATNVCAAPVAFDWFEYTGRDAVFERPLPPGSYRNPVLAGFYPDPSITRAGNRYYLVNSTFAYFPGIPVFESTDLVHWRLIGHVIERESQLDLTGLGVSRGIFAPAIEHHNGTFYVVGTAVDRGGNFIVTAKDPAGPWSDPVWLPQIDGIDPSLFIDTDGKAYILNNGPPEGEPLYDGHRAIWIQEFDLEALRLFGPRKVLVNGGVDLSRKPIWIEGPHLYRRGEWYYLMCAEGGTGPDHSEVIFRGRSPWGPFEPYAHNPILTQRDLPANRPDPIENAGHADIVEGPDGRWWAVFLASRTYGDGDYNTGRETCLLPVTWRDGWPVILESGQTIPYVATAPAPVKQSHQAPLSGNFTWRDEFDSPDLNPFWLRLRTARRAWIDLHSRPGFLQIEPLSDPLDGKGNPSFLARRQQHTTFDASTELHLPSEEGVSAGLAAFQSESYWYFLGARRTGGTITVFVEKKAGREVATIASAVLDTQGPLRLKITGDGQAYSFFRGNENGEWTPLLSGDDGSILSTRVAGGFVGAVVGPYARREAPK